MYCLLYSFLIPQNTFGICSFWPDIVLFSGAIHAILSFPPTCRSNTTKICTTIGPMTTTIPWRTTKTLKTIMARTGAIYEDTIALKLKLNSCVAIIRNRVFCFFKKSVILSSMFSDHIPQPKKYYKNLSLNSNGHLVSKSKIKSHLFPSVKSHKNGERGSHE